MNIMFYLYLKASGVPVKSHPVIQRIVEIKKVRKRSCDPPSNQVIVIDQLSQLIGQLEPLASEMEGQIEDLLASLNSGEKRTSEAIEKKMVTTTAKDHSAMDTGAMDSGASKKLRKRKQRVTETESMITSLKKKSTKISEEVEDPLEYYDRVLEEKKRKREQKRERKSRKEVADDEEEVEFEEGEDGKRAVTYQVYRYTVTFSSTSVFCSDISQQRVDSTEKKGATKSSSETQEEV